MKYSIELESPFALSSFWYAVGAGLILLALILWYLFTKVFRVNVESPLRSDKLHRDCVRGISDIKAAYGKGEIDSRAAHQKMSALVRKYVQDMTGLQTQNMVYSDLLGLQRPELAQLISQYYEPEFAYSSGEDANPSIDKGKELVDTIHRREVLARRIMITSSFRREVNLKLGRIIGKVPAALRPFFLSRVRRSSLKWVKSIHDAFRKGKLDSYGVHDLMCTAVRSFVCAAAGAPQMDTAPATSLPVGPENAEMVPVIRVFFNPSSACRTEEAALSEIERGKELIQKWV